MATKFTHQLHVVVYSKALAEQLSVEVEAAFPEVGPNNVACELVAANADEKSTATAWEFSAPVKPAYIEWLDSRIKQLPPQAKSLVKWWRKDRSNNVERRHDNDKPVKAKFTDDDGRAEAAVKLRKPRIDGI
jgi:hypothetical protein